ncbi:MAG: carbonic anhydrase [Ferruginibacter sp.]
MKKTIAPISLLFIVIFFTSCNQKAADTENKQVVADAPKPSHPVINTPDDALEELKNGNQRYFDNKLINTNYKEEMEETKDGQHPHSIILSCIDSRVPPEIIFDQGLGNVFVARVAGNIVDPNELGSLEFATQVKHSKLIVVLGHRMCGAIDGAVNNVQLGSLTQLLSQIKPAITGDSTNKPLMLELTTKKNIQLTVENILKGSPIISNLVKEGKVKIVGAYDDINIGKVIFL